jgi:hypothetical protein
MSPLPVRKAWWIAVIVALIAIPLALSAWHAPEKRETSAAYVPPPNRHVSKFDIREVCTSGTPSQVLIGSARLYLDLRVLESLTLAEGEVWPSRCPTRQLRVAKLWFYIADKVSGSVYRERGLRLFYLGVQDAAATSWHGPQPVRTAPNSRITIEGRGTIDHISEEVLRFGPGTQSGYSLQHLADSDGVRRPPIEMTCSGLHSKTSQRKCHTTYVFDGLVLEYKFTQSGGWRVHDRFDIPPDGAIREPEGLLDFDRKVRDWIIDLRRPPNDPIGN